MLPRNAVAAAALVMLLALVAGPAARAAGPIHAQAAHARVTTAAQTRTPAQALDEGGGEDGGGKHGNGNGKSHGHDPCDKKHMPAFCQSAPEAPAGLLYPAAALIALTVFFGFERRRRTRAAQAA